MAADFLTDAHGGHRNRLRQRVVNEGFDGLEPHEILEFLLCYAIPRQDVNALAHALIRRFGSVGGVLGAELPELMSVEGVGARTARWLALVGEAAAACAQLRPEDRPSLANYMDVFRYAIRAGREAEIPCCMQLCLDGEGRLLYRRTICPSLSWGEAETMREALADVLTLRARNAILLLFMGPRFAAPAPYDLSHIRDYAYTLYAADSALLDVVIVGADAPVSMRQQGLIPDYSNSEGMRALREDYMRGMPERADAFREQSMRQQDMILDYDDPEGA